MFLQQQDYEWFARDIKKPYKVRLEVYSAISRSFSNIFRRKSIWEQLSGFIYRMENLFLSLYSGALGAIPSFPDPENGQPARFSANREAMLSKGEKTGKALS